MQKILSETAKNMVEVHFLRENAGLAAEGLHKRGIRDAENLIEEIIGLDDRRKILQGKRDDLLHRINKASKEIGALYQKGEREEADEQRLLVGRWKEDVGLAEAELEKVSVELRSRLLDMPNIPHASVAAGSSEEDNEVIRENLDGMRKKGEEDLPHWDLMAQLDIVDLALGAKITGSGFPVFKGKGARLQRALVQFFLDRAGKAGCTEIAPPILVNSASATGTGQLPDKEGQMYYVEKDDLYLIPTSEVPVTNIFRDEILKREQLPVKFTAFTPCFRREAGSYGADVKGLNRVHQFDKVEMVVFSKPEDSYQMLDWMVEHVAGLLDDLKLPYRILRLCGGDLGMASALTYDFEVYSVTQERWLEVSSVSNFETYQSNRMKIRYRTEDGTTRLVHTLNGSVLALPRIIAAILENYQKDGEIKIPEVLRTYTGFECIK